MRFSVLIEIYCGFAVWGNFRAVFRFLIDPNAPLITLWRNEERHIITLSAFNSTVTIVKGKVSVYVKCNIYLPYVR